MPPSEFRRLLDDLGMRATSRHLDVAQCLDRESVVIEESIEIGYRDVVSGMPHELRSSLGGYQAHADVLNEVSKALAEHDLRLSYHNHHWEFDLHDGERGYDHLFARLSSAVNAQLDVYWLVRAGRDPVEYINAFSGRVPLIHMKDMEPGDEQFFAEVGNGVLDMPAIVAAADAAGTEWYIVEQDKSRGDSMESTRMSYDYLAQLCEQ